MPATEPPTPTFTPASTTTIIWFPPTATPTPFPTQPITPTPDLRPGLGGLILSDDFSQANSWQLVSSPQGSIALGKNELTLAISEPGAYLSSSRTEPFLTDFYVEITASPTLCRGADEYGLLLRMTSANDFYRFSLTCDSQVRLDRLVQGKASSPQPLTFAGIVPPGAPSISRLAVWSLGKEMRFFINDMYVFTVNDPMLPGGVLGVFARSNDDTAVTVNFTDLIVREIVK